MIDPGRTFTGTGHALFTEWEGLAGPEPAFEVTSGRARESRRCGKMAVGEYELFTARRRARLEVQAEDDTMKQLEDAAKNLLSAKRTGRKRQQGRRPQTKSYELVG